MERDKIKSLLPLREQQLFEDIVTSRVLGANCHIRLIGEMLTGIAKAPENSREEILDKTRQVADFFMQTRGRQSRAIYNAVRYYIKGLDALCDRGEQEVRDSLAARVLSYKEKSEKDMETLIGYAKNLTENMDTIMIFDYSSTVNDFIAALEKKMTVYIPESRALDGGRPFVKAAVRAGHEVHFIPDTTMFSALKKCQAAFMGAETVYPDGTVFNTIGSDILAVLCEKLRIPLYVLTPMIKLDVRPVTGYIRLSPIPFDYGPRLASHWEEKDREGVDFSGFKLLEVAPEYIRALITEEGILPPYALFSVAMKYAGSLEEL